MFLHLRDGGEYEFMKLDEASWKKLNVVPPLTGGYTPVYLKAIFLNTKILIRPLYKNLVLTPIGQKVKHELVHTTMQAMIA